MLLSCEIENLQLSVEAVGLPYAPCLNNPVVAHDHPKG